ncbi:protein S100-P-like [Bombina bombina]|uniref:protein S100-P-like n=1 Tax=Bombina bombina TaxID=8345 RepID=UPI00235AEA84|nr:protein S100-P-like [Bombina bombina]
MSGNLENFIGILTSTFRKYAGKDGKDSTLSQDELCDLAVKEFPTLCNSSKKDDILKGIIGQMDMDGDKTVTFKEFVMFTGFLAIALEDI